MPDSPVARNEEWPAQAADTIVHVVGVARDRTIVPARVIVKALAYGLLALVLGGAAAIIAAIGFVRGLDILVAEVMDGQETWIAHLIVGVPFTLVGLWLVLKARRALGALTDT